MAEHEDYPSPRAGAGVRVRLVAAVASVLSWVGVICAAVLVAHVVLTLGGANPDNGITRFVAGWADPLALGFHDLFLPADPDLAVLVNYGIAALFWLVLRAIVLRVVRRLG
ncbi:hypothetical protein [Goodfellowiella coeruleoviolacea]|uniref:YggT family protein n=1 Tax=Goodfellowiella coeruleoviolacea TaxID=334858 RepID=A0AAE3GA84_9PSEU|nr:hypothetical protein [Goodfellowiella coeruleoviolacea]MCP2164551.1 hypothetical protein [Goodfellowiella coeruleoviolacea]